MITNLKLAAVAAALLLATVLFAQSAFAEGNLETGKQLAYTCLGCHGIKNHKNIYPTYHVPKVCGQNSQYLLDALNGYASGDRPHETMHAQAATLSEQARQDIAAYFADKAACGKGD